MLVGVADDSGTVACDGGRRGGSDIEPVDEREPRRRTLEACDDADERRLARAARTEYDADLAPLDPLTLVLGTAAFAVAAVALVTWTTRRAFADPRGPGRIGGEG